MNKTTNKQITAKNIFLVGNPNCGKTSLFNALTGERKRVGNWPGVTVERIQGIKQTENHELVVTDLPGTYSLSPATPEEEVVLKALDDASSEIILNVVDTGNLERNLFLTTQLIELGLTPTVALNCFDSFTNAGGSIDLKKFSTLSGTMPFPTVARTGEGATTLLDHLDKIKPVKLDTCESSLKLPDLWQKATDKALKLSGNSWKKAAPYARYKALTSIINHQNTDVSKELIDIRTELAEQLSKKADRKLAPNDLACELASDRYRRIENLIKFCAIVPEKNISPAQEKLDRLLTHRFLGLPIFALLMGWVFWTTFNLGGIPMEWLESLFGWLGTSIGSVLPDGLIKALIVDGIIAGVGGVLVFLPNIIILFFWIAILEDSGYMSRAAFLMDRMMNSIGLHGRAFIPMVMGLGCNVPAVMATRIIENRGQRLLTMLLIPLITCAARLPVLVLLCGTFFSENPSLWMFLLFFFNLSIIIFLGQFTSLFFRSSGKAPFLLEMPPYRFPTVSSVFHMLSEKGMHFVEKAGTVILAGSVLIWVLSVFPREVPLSQNFDAKIAQIKTLPASDENIEKIVQLKRQRDIEQMEGRYMARLAKVVHPVMEPLGFSWRETVSLIPGFLAKEAVVSTLSVLYLPISEDLGKAMKEGGMDKLKAFVFMLFTLLYIPCIATVGVTWRESGSGTFTIFSLFVYFAIAYITSFSVLKVGNILLEADKAGTFAFHEGAIIIAIGVFAGWYLFKTFFVTISGSYCKTCASCNGCSNSKSGNCPEA